MTLENYNKISKYLLDKNIPFQAFIDSPCLKSPFMFHYTFWKRGEYKQVLIDSLIRGFSKDGNCSVTIKVY